MCLAPMAQAYVIVDVKSYNQIISPAEALHWDYTLADYGFVAGRDHWITRPMLTIGIIPNGFPCEDYDQHPFVNLWISGDREYGRACKDLQYEVFFPPEGKLDIYMQVDYFTSVTDISLKMEFAPGPTVLPEPSGWLVMVTSLVLLAWRRRFDQRVWLDEKIERRDLQQ